MLSEQLGLLQLYVAGLGFAPRQPVSATSPLIHSVPDEETEAPRG